VVLESEEIRAILSQLQPYFRLMVELVVIQSHLRHSRADTTANESMQELPESVQQMVGTVYAMLTEATTPQQIM
jgi:hypothetical protein